MPRSGLRSYGGRLFDRSGREVLWRGVNVGGSSRVPYSPNGATQLGVDFTRWADVSFVGRPFPLEDADRHLDRIAHWGFDAVRLVVTWEAIEHAGPGVYDEAYLDYLRRITRKAQVRGIDVVVDLHQDSWSRWSGGDGAPFWCFEWAGLAPERFRSAQAVSLHDTDWQRNLDRVPAAAMSTLFFGGNDFCPELTGLQNRLQDHYVAAVRTIAAYLADVDAVVGYDVVNEPSPGYIGRGQDLTRPRRFRGGPDRPTPSALEALAAADGEIVMLADGRSLNPRGVSIWLDGCPWREAGVWDLDASGAPVLLDDLFFREVDGTAVSFWDDHLAPFLHRLAWSVHEVDPDALILVQGPVGERALSWDDPEREGRVVSAPHFYDPVVVAGGLVSGDDHLTPDGRHLRGVEDLTREYTGAFGDLAEVGRTVMGDLATVVGEFGVPFATTATIDEASDENDLAARRMAATEAAEVSLEALFAALDACGIGGFVWNYTGDNTHGNGDHWNLEDFSIFSIDDAHDPTAPDSGGRALASFCRPHVRAAAGTVRSQRFADGVFELVIDPDPLLAMPTVVYVPAIHFPRGVTVTSTSGEAHFDPDRQELRWDGPVPARSGATLRIAPASPERPADAFDAVEVAPDDV